MRRTENLPLSGLGRTAAAASIRMIALDIDGTLVDSRQHIGARTVAAIDAARDAGIEVVIATGRRHAYALPLLESLSLPMESAIISSNGAVVREANGRLLWRTELDLKVARELAKSVGSLRNTLVFTFDRGVVVHAVVEAEADSGIDVDAAVKAELNAKAELDALHSLDLGSADEHASDETRALLIEDRRSLTGVLARWVEQNESDIVELHPIERGLEADAPIQAMICGEIAPLREAENSLHAGPLGKKLAICRTEYPDRDLCMVDILPAGCGKGFALARLAAERKILRQEVLAIGDNFNDVDMLEFAGRAVLMGNASVEMKALGRQHRWETTAGNDQEGVALTIAALLREQNGNRRL